MYNNSRRKTDFKISFENLKLKSKNEMKIEREIEMTFDYNTLKRAAKDGLRLGSWNGKAVFAAPSSRLDNLSSGAYYILYDDDNKIVAKTSNGWKSYGEVTEQGSVSEYSSARTYRTPAEVAEAARKASTRTSTSGMRYSSEPIPQATMKVCGYTVDATEGTYAPGYDVSERPTGDVKLEIDVEGTLKKAREMTVESLLDGFLLGVDFSVAKG